jgi:hypothetical protein
MGSRRQTRARLAVGAAAVALAVTGAGVAVAAQGPSDHPAAPTHARLDTPNRTHDGAVRAHGRQDDRVRPGAERRNGTDDPVGHELREHVRRAADDPAWDDGGGHGADDPAGHDHGRHGGDDSAGDDHGSDG